MVQKLNGALIDNMKGIFAQIGEVPRVIDPTARKFGAKGDGTTDDSAAIQAAIDAAGDAGGGLVFLPAGTFRVGSALTVSDSNIHIVGAGRDLTTLDGGGANASAIVLADAATISYFEVRDLTIRNFANNGVQASNAHSGINAVVVSNCQFSKLDIGINLRAAVLSNVIIDGCKMDTLVSGGIVLGQNTFSAQDTMEKFVVRNNIITDVDDTTATGRPNSGGSETHGILCYGREMVIEGNIIQDVVNDGETDCEGIYTKGRYVTIANNVLVDAGRAFGAITVKGNNRPATAAPQGYDNTIVGNQIFAGQTNTYGISVWNADTLVTGNIIEGPTETAILVREEIRLFFVAITNNVIRRWGKRGIHIRGPHSNIKVTGNILGNARDDTIAYGIEIRNTSNTDSMETVEIAHNSILFFTGAGAQVGILFPSNTEAVDKVKIHHNILDGVDTGIDFGTTGLVTDVEVVHNDLEGVTTPIINAGNVPVIFARHNAGWTEEHAFTDGDATPSVARWIDGQFVVAGSTAITDFDDGIEGRVIYVRGNGSVQITHGTNIFNRSGGNITPGSNEIRAYVLRSGDWIEV